MPVYTDKKTGKLYIEFQYKGQRVKERLPAGTTKAAASVIETKLRSDLLFHSHGIATQKPLTFEQFIAEYYSPIADSYSAEKKERAVQIVKAALPFLKGKALRDIKATDIERFKASRIELLTQHKTIRKPATVEREMSVLSGVFAVAVRNDLIDYNPCSRVPKLSFDNVQDKLLRRSDEEKFFENMTSLWAKDVCRMVLNTGLRQNDLMNLTRFQVDRENKLITLIQGKTKRRVVIALNSVALEIINRRWKQNLLFASPKTGRSDGSVRSIMKRACIKAKIPVLTIRDLRRTFGTRMIENGVDAVTVARSLGHSDLRMIPTYVRSIELMQKGVDLLVQSPQNPPAAKLDNVESIDRKTG